MAKRVYRHYDIWDRSAGKLVSMVPADEVFECLFWIFSLYSQELASDDVVEACSHVARCVASGCFESGYLEDCQYLNIFIHQCDKSFPEYYESDVYDSYLAGHNGVRWSEYSAEMATWYRMANGKLEAC